MLNYSIGEFFGLLLTFGNIVFFSLIGLKGIFMVMSKFLDKENVLYHYHYHHADKNRNLDYKYRDKIK